MTTNYSSESLKVSTFTSIEATFSNFCSNSCSVLVIVCLAFYYSTCNVLFVAIHAILFAFLFHLSI